MTLSEQARAKAAGHTADQLAKNLIDLVEHVQDWDESSSTWDCDCAAPTAAALDEHDPTCPYLLYFMLSSLVLEAAKRLRNVPALLPAYAELLPTLREEARRHGYALALHGSGQRDLDLVAVPWVAEASPPAQLAEALRAAVGGFIRDEPDALPGDYTRRSPEPKPHGRLAWSIHLDEPSGRRYIDLSIMSRAGLPEDVTAWLQTGERGASSETIVEVLEGLPQGTITKYGRDYPSNPADLRRCLLLLQAVPRYQHRLHELAMLSDQWAALVVHWSELEALLLEEVPGVLNGGRGDAPRTWRRMVELHSPKWVEAIFGDKPDTP